MTYSVFLNNNLTRINIADNAIDTTTSLTLVGRNYLGYGQFLAQDLVNLLQNFASSTAPNNPVIGQIWYDTSGQIINVCTNTNPVTWSGQTTGVSEVAGLVGNITVDELYTAGVAKVASPSFTGTPTAPLPTGTPTNQIATVQYVTTQIAALNTTVTANARIKLVSPLTLHVGGVGASDSNDGLTTGTGFATIQRAVDVAATQYDLQATAVTVQVADGTYLAGAAALAGGFTGVINFIGNPTTPTNCRITATGAAFSAAYNVSMTLNGFAIEATGATGGDYAVSGVAIAASNGASVGINHIAFGPCSAIHMYTQNGGAIGAIGPGISYSIYGSAGNHFFCDSSGVIGFAQASISVTANLSFGTFAVSSAAGSVYINGATIALNAHTVTGQRYFARLAGSINTGGAGTNFFPGSVAGDAASGYYI